MALLNDNRMILGACLSLVDPSMLDYAERRLLDGVTPIDDSDLEQVLLEIRAGRDPLGEAYMEANAPADRRSHGETYTPSAMVESMVLDAGEMGTPARVVDAGCGSGRFAIACAKTFPRSQVVAVDASPFATLMTKASVCALGLEDRITVLRGDFTTIGLPALGEQGPTLWIGNPPYVRHHDLPARAKQWLARTSKHLGVHASGLSGLHVHFIFSIAQRVNEGDFGVLVTSAEWLDVKYGKAVRELLLRRLGLRGLELRDRTKQAFAGTDTTALIFSFDTRLLNTQKRETSVRAVAGERAPIDIPRKLLDRCDKWTPLLDGRLPRDVPKGYVKLGDFARVHRGIVTGANKFWVRQGLEDPDESISVPVVSHAREIMTGSSELHTEGLSRLIALPQDIETLDEGEAEKARQLIAEGESLGIDKGYVARSRKCWWSIPVGDGATILMTYMARKPPVFVANPKRIRSLNVVHGIYPLVDLSDNAVNGLVDYLNTSVVAYEGRTYSGGLMKFEPREVENILVPSPQMLEEGSWRS